MKFCSKCGTQLADTAVFCSSCGEAVDPAASAGQQGNYGQTGNQSYSQQGSQGYGQPYVDYSNPQADADANKVYGILAYLGLLVFVSIFAAPKESRYSRFHANQGAVLLIVAVGFAVAFGIVNGVGTAILAVSLLWSVAAIFGVLIAVVWLAYGAGILALVIMGIINAANGVCKPLPVIGKYTIIK